jgi:oxygen-independent coproporphyrinogen III oxidase
MALGLYVSVPFCRTKCSYCNFASDVFSRAIFAKYVERVCTDIHSTTIDRSAEDGPAFATGRKCGLVERDVDTIYLGGGTPTVLESQQLEQIFVTIRQEFRLSPETEITVECAPGTLSAPVLDTLLRCGVNRVSLGVQSFVDQEAASVGRLHKRATVCDDIARLRAAGIANINVDLIAGLPHQNAESWGLSVSETIASGAPHASVYMLEVDEDSRLGRELMAGGARYHAHFVPDDELTADLYLTACERLNGAGVAQYEISNFARPGFESKHNLRYWTRQPYLGFGVDAHSMLPIAIARHDGDTPRDAAVEAVRWSTPDQLEEYVAGKLGQHTPVTKRAALEESFFLGLRLNRGVRLPAIEAQFGADALSAIEAGITQSVEDGLLERTGDSLRLTARGRLLSNEVFERFLAPVLKPAPRPPLFANR